MKEIFTTGFPRSGNTWLWRTLCDLFNAPQQATPNLEVDTQFAEIIDDIYIIRKTHWYRNQYSGIGYNGERSKIVLVSRDPRDMVVSMMCYRRQDDLEHVIHSIGPNSKGPGFASFVDGWINSHPDFWIYYEQLHMQPEFMLSECYRVITGFEPLPGKVERVIQRQKFSNWAPKFPASMRKGVIGDWRNYFTRNSGQLMESFFGSTMRALGYTTDSNWWRNL